MIEEKEGEKQSLFGSKIFIFVPLIFFIGLIFIMFYLSGHFFVQDFFVCGDGTSYGNCSIHKPYLCDEGVLVEKASFCGCPNEFQAKENLCYSEYKNNAKDVVFNYTLDGKKKELQFTLYGGVYDYVSQIPRTISYNGGKQPSRQDFKLLNINDSLQREFLLPLVLEIQNSAKDKTDQARIAISLVQEIPFGSSSKSLSFGRQVVNYSRYSYEVLYDNKGVCGEKSELLTFLLRELGFDTSIFYYSNENHEAVGIKCPEEYGVGETGYCFIETSGPSIMTNNELEYVGGVKLLSMPEVIPISLGDSIEEGLKEYSDARSFIKIEKKIEETSQINFFDNWKLKKLNKRYGLVEVYNI